MRNLSNADVRDLEHEVLLERFEELLAVYDAPREPEIQSARIDRLSRTIEEVPEVYRWLNHLQSWADHWTDSLNELYGISDRRYKAMRQRRDLITKMASSAKMRYEAASRIITIIQNFDPDGLPKSR